MAGYEPNSAEYAVPDGMDTNEVLKTVFHHYAAFGRTHADVMGQATLDSSNFAKMCKQCPGLFSRRLSRSDADIVFSRIAPRGERCVWKKEEEEEGGGPRARGAPSLRVALALASRVARARARGRSGSLGAGTPKLPPAMRRPRACVAAPSRTTTRRRDSSLPPTRWAAACVLGAPVRQ